jgi:hypothetical protein
VKSREVDACFGAFFLVLAVAVVAFADAATDAGALAVAFVLLLLGGDAVLAAVAGRRSLLSRIGPLP